MTTPAPTPHVFTPDVTAVDDDAHAVPQRDDSGMATAEYAIATLAACGFAGLLLVILQGGQVRGLVTGLIERALTVG